MQLLEIKFLDRSIWQASITKGVNYRERCVRNMY
jgi:hypothetical protein